MVRFRETPVTDETAQLLLAEYFSSRELSFPAAQGRYQPSYPDPALFVPPCGVFLVVEGVDADGTAADVGCGGIRRIENAGGGAVRYEVKHLWLQPHTRGHGYGTGLLQELESRALDFGAQELVLDTNDSLTAAGRLYNSSGFTRIEPYNDNPNATRWFAKKLTVASTPAAFETS